MADGMGIEQTRSQNGFNAVPSWRSTHALDRRGVEVQAQYLYYTPRDKT